MSVVPQALPTSYPDTSSMLNTAHIVSATTAANIPESQGSSSSNSNSPSPVPTQQTTSSSQASETQSLDNDKKAIYRHPLFPLMALLFEKCERATQTPECPSADSFDVDIQAFVQHQEKDRKPFFSDDTELDGLMVKAIQVLRIHLLELEKVNELCKDFCNRYITCLKSKMQSEHLLRTEVPSPPPNFDGSLSSSSSGSVTPNHTATGGSSSSSSSQLPNASSAISSSSTSTATAAAATLQSQLQQQQQQHQQQVVAPMAANNVLIQQGLAAAQSAAVSMGSLGQGQIGGTVYRMVQTPQGIVAQPIQIQATPISNQVNTMTTGQSLIHGSTPLSQIGVVGAPTIATSSGSSTPCTVSAQIASIATNSLSQMGSDDEDILCKRKTKRGILPKTATKIMKSWLFQHIVHPYPTEDEKRQIAAQTNLTLLQVNNWFINARRRILQPMLDASNPDQAKVKKNKPQNRPLQRFWPDNIANLRPQMPSSHEGDLSENSSPLSPGGCSGGGGASNDSTSIVTSSQPSTQHLVVLSMAPTATTSTAIVTADGHLAVSLERLHSHQVAAHCSLSNSPGPTPIIIENSNDTNNNATIINTPTTSIISTNVAPNNNKVDNVQNNNNDDDDLEEEEENELDPVSEEVNRNNLCLGDDNSERDSSPLLD